MFHENRIPNQNLLSPPENHYISSQILKQYVSVLFQGGNMEGNVVGAEKIESPADHSKADAIAGGN